MDQVEEDDQLMILLAGTKANKAELDNPHSQSYWVFHLKSTRGLCSQIIREEVKLASS
jgi:hypothetical protein